jgi:magnesium chelatase family protein
MLVKTFSSAVFGIDARTITVELTTGGNVLAGNSKFHMVGLPDNAVREGTQRIETAIKNIGIKYPRVRTVVNLAPANVRKEGSAFDLPIALGILSCLGHIPRRELASVVMVGELSLDGSLRPIKGALPIALQARRDGFEALLLPVDNASEASMVTGLRIFGVKNLQQAIDLLNSRSALQPISALDDPDAWLAGQAVRDDFSDVKGQLKIKRAMEIAAAGGHNAILIGPPGAGKTMMARRIPGILPPFTLSEAIETTKVHSVAGMLPPEDALVRQRPFRAPHHTISDVALVGGGGVPMPGEISLAHHGVLFLDELPEFKRSVLEVLRQPMEERQVTISRARFSVNFPANFMLIASMNPCPCGFYNHPEKPCLCHPGAVKRYLNKISGPLLDRIDLHVEVTPVSYDELTDAKPSAEGSVTIRDRVIAARKIQWKRFESQENVYSNAQMSGRLIRQYCTLNQASTKMLEVAMKKLQLSARAYDRILKVARTIADLEGNPGIESSHIAEAIQFRNLDRADWAG